MHRDSEESAPAEYPPDQPEADQVDDDGAAYGHEEVELEEGLKAELAEQEAKIAAEGGEDEDMEGADDTAGVKDGEDSDAGSEDLEAESSETEDEDLEEEAGEGEAEEDMEMGEGDSAAPHDEQKDRPQHQATPEVMVH